MEALKRYGQLVDDLVCRQRTKFEGTIDGAQLEVLQRRLTELSDTVAGNSSATVLEPLKGRLEEIEQSGGWTHIKKVIHDSEQFNGFPVN